LFRSKAHPWRGVRAADSRDRCGAGAPQRRSRCLRPRHPAYLRIALDDSDRDRNRRGRPLVPCAAVSGVDVTRTGTALAAGCCLVAFLAAALLPSLGPADPVAMPTTPAWLTAVAAAAAAVLVLVTSRARVRITGIVATGACAAVMAAGSLLALPHTVLMVVERAANLITGAGGSFEVAAAWSATLMHLAVLAV